MVLRGFFSRPRAGLRLRLRPRLGALVLTRLSPTRLAPSFGSFDFNDDDSTQAPPASANGGGDDDEWGDSWGSPQAKKAPEPAPVVDDPWAEAGKPMQSSLFAYDCAKMHAKSEPAVSSSSSKPKAQKSIFDNVGLGLQMDADNSDTGNGFGGFDARDASDPYGTLARDKFAGASAISSSSFQSAMPEDKLPAVDPAVRAAEEAAAKERKLLELGIAGASGFGSMDLEDQPSPGKARQLAGAGLGAAYAVGGYAASGISSLLARGREVMPTSPPKP